MNPVGLSAEDGMSPVISSHKSYRHRPNNYQISVLSFPPILSRIATDEITSPDYLSAFQVKSLSHDIITLDIDVFNNQQSFSTNDAGTKHGDASDILHN